LQSQNISVEPNRALKISDNDVSLEYVFDSNHTPQPSFQDWSQRLDLAVIVLPGVQQKRAAESRGPSRSVAMVGSSGIEVQI
jgi:hypothetical protein